MKKYIITTILFALFILPSAVFAGTYSENTGNVTVESFFFAGDNLTAGRGLSGIIFVASEDMEVTSATYHIKNNVNPPPMGSGVISEDLLKGYIYEINGTALGNLIAESSNQLQAGEDYSAMTFNFNNVEIVTGETFAILIDRVTITDSSIFFIGVSDVAGDIANVWLRDTGDIYTPQSFPVVYNIQTADTSAGNACTVGTGISYFACTISTVINSFVALFGILIIFIVTIMWPYLLGISIILMAYRYGRRLLKL